MTTSSLAPAPPRSLPLRSLTRVTKKILIADDSHAFRELERQLLKSRGYELLVASDGVEAVRAAFKEIPDLVLLDLEMPIMSGCRALAILKSHAQTRQIPVVIVTTRDSLAERARLSQAGAAAFLAKPIDGAHLTWVVRGLLEKKEEAELLSAQALR